MNKGQFLKELKVRLKYLHATDREDAIRFYDEYISEMELSDDEDVTAKLGTPKEVASDIISQCTQKQIDDTKEQRTVKGSAKTAWLVILGILSLPLSLPIVILIATFLFVLIVLILAAVVVIFAGALAIPWALFVPGFAQKMFTLGYGLISLGIGVLITYALTALLRKIIRSITSKRRARVYANE
jgi:uncharacterized membrane protein